MRIRPYRDPDRDSVASLWRVVFPDDPPWNVPEEDIERKLKVQPELFLVAEDDGKIAGTTMGGYDGHRGWIYLVAVSPDYRRKGVGRMLMEEVEQRLAEIGCPKLNLQVRGTNKEVVEFYKKLGYVVEDRVSMGKRLKDEG
jgi:ribosomal protein S18 acetylase RimI-like enzyme